MKLKIEYIDSQESFGMSGPWIGKLRIDGQDLRNEFLDENYIKTEDEKFFAFNRFEAKDQDSKLLWGLIKYSTIKKEFKILILDSDKEKWYLSNSSWDSLYLTRMTKEKVFFTNAFHDQDRKMFPEKSIDFNKDTFSEISSEKIIKTPHNHKK